MYRSPGSILHYSLPYPLRSAISRMMNREYYSRLEGLRSKEGNGSLAPFDEHECIFVHVPKAAGVSVGRSMFGLDPGIKHTKLRGYEVLFGRERFNRYYKFTFVRNPWDRTVSAFEFLRQGGMTQNDIDWVEAHPIIKCEFRNFVMQWLTPRNVYKHIVMVPQWEFLTIRSKVEVDFVGHYENLRDDFNKVTRTLNLGCSLEHCNKTKSRKDYRAYYDEETIQRIASVYRKDIELFGYSFDG